MNATRPPSRPPDERDRGFPRARPPAVADVPRRATQVLYRQPGIYVTSDWLIVAGQRFPIRELTRLQTARGPRDPVTARAILVTGTVVAAVGLALGFIRDIGQVGAGTWLALGAAAFVPIVIAVIGQRMRPRSYELWGQYQGRTVLLLSTDDERQYGQVTRALMRAQEMARLGGVRDPVASTIPWLPGSW